MRAIINTLSAFVLSAVCSIAVAGSVNVNTADAETLAKELDGIGPAKAQAIIDYRSKNGSFSSAEDLLAVKGIGDKLLEDNLEQISVVSE